jgi:hypothetical protein
MTFVEDVVCRINFPYLDTKISRHFQVFDVKQARSDAILFATVHARFIFALKWRKRSF